MIKGKHWPIPHNEIMNGSIITLKNAHRLTEDAKILLQEKRYSTALTIATLALEEFGKHCMFNENISINSTIVKKIWHEKFESHKNKILAIPKHLERFSISTDVNTQKKLQEFSTYLNQLSTTKIKSLYVDWDGKNNNWFYYDDNSTDKKEDAEKAVNCAIWCIEEYLKDIGGDLDLILTIPSQLTVLMGQNKIHRFCNKCLTVILDNQEFMKHNSQCDRIPDWYWNN